jgi:hypothetical protein
LIYIYYFDFIIIFLLSISNKRRGLKFICWFYIYYFDFNYRLLLSISNERPALKFIGCFNIYYFHVIISFVLSISNKRRGFKFIIFVLSLPFTSLLASCHPYPTKDEDLNSFVDFNLYFFYFMVGFLLSISNEISRLKFICWFISLTFTSSLVLCYRYPIENEGFHSLVALISLPLTSIMGSYYGNAKKVKNLNSFVGLYLLLSLHY